MEPVGLDQPARGGGSVAVGDGRGQPGGIGAWRRAVRCRRRGHPRPRRLVERTVRGRGRRRPGRGWRRARAGDLHRGAGPWRPSDRYRQCCRQAGRDGQRSGHRAWSPPPTRCGGPRPAAQVAGAIGPAAAAPAGRATRCRWRTAARARSTRSAEPTAPRWSPGRWAPRSRPAGGSTGRTAVIEMARASGLELVGGAEGNDPVAASTAGTGELIVAAIDSGATRVIVAVGGSATHRRRARRAAGPSPARPPQGHRPHRRLRRAHGLRRCGDGVRPAEGRHRRPGRAAAAPPRAPGPGVPRRARRRRAALEGAGAAGGLAGGLAAAGARLRVAASTSWPTRWSSTTGSRAPTWSSPPRASSTRRASRARSWAASPSWPRHAGVPCWPSPGRSSTAMERPHRGRLARRALRRGAGPHGHAGVHRGGRVRRPRRPPA